MPLLPSPHINEVPANGKGLMFSVLDKLLSVLRWEQENLQACSLSSACAEHSCSALLHPDCLCLFILRAD